VSDEIGSLLVLDIYGEGYYHAIWYWLLDEIQCVAVLWRGGETWYLDTLADHGLPPARWSRPALLNGAPATQAELDRFLGVMYECAQRGAATAGADLSEPVKLDLRCMGTALPARMRAFAKLGRLPAGLKGWN